MAEVKTGNKPSFITGATAKIKVAGQTMAYAQDVSYSTTVTTIPIETMGRYEVVSNEPVAYFVDGGLSIIRYTAEAAGMAGTNSAGNSVNQMASSVKNGFDPSKLIASETFDVEIFQKRATGEPILVAKLRDCRFTRKGGNINKRGVLTEVFSFNAILIDNDDTAQAGHSGDIDLA